MKYIVEFEDEPCMYEDEVHFYKCIQAPWWGLSERVIKQLTPYQPDAPDTNVGNITNLCAHENDPISRQMAIDTIMGQPPEPHYPSWYAAQIEKLPAVQPKTTTMTVGRTKGEITMWYECDNCGEPVDQRDNYCWNCGRRFKKDERPDKQTGGD